MNNLKSTSLAFIIAIVLFSFNACKKRQKGVIEVKVTHHTYDPVTNQLVTTEETYHAKTAEDITGGSSYPVETEFILNHDDDAIGFFWPEESLKSLGYKYSNDRVNFFADKEKTGKVPGENGHWGKNGSGSSGSGACIEGTWYSDACAAGDKGVIWIFKSDKTGSFSNEDCNGICTPMVYTFTYKVTGNTCNITYDAEQPIVHCTGFQDSRPGKPSDDVMTFTCNGNELNVSSSTGSNTFTK